LKIIIDFLCNLCTWSDANDDDSYLNSNLCTMQTHWWL